MLDKLMDRLRHRLGMGTPLHAAVSFDGHKPLQLTSPAEKAKALQMLADHRLQLSRLDVEVDAYRAAAKAHRLRRRAGERG